MGFLHRDLRLFLLPVNFSCGCQGPPIVLFPLLCLLCLGFNAWFVPEREPTVVPWHCIESRCPWAIFYFKYMMDSYQLKHEQKPNLLAECTRARRSFLTLNLPVSSERAYSFPGLEVCKSRWRNGSKWQVCTKTQRRRWWRKEREDMVGGIWEKGIGPMVKGAYITRYIQRPDMLCRESKRSSLSRIAIQTRCRNLSFKVSIHNFKYLVIIRSENEEKDGLDLVTLERVPWLACFPFPLVEYFLLVLFLDACEARNTLFGGPGNLDHTEQPERTGKWEIWWSMLLVQSSPVWMYD